MGGLSRLAINAAALAIAAVGLAPFALLALLAFSERPASIGGFTLENFAFILTGQLFNDPRYSGLYPNIHVVTINTLALALGVSGIVVLLSSTAGYVLSRHKIPGRGVMLGVVLALHGIPVIILLIGLYFLLRSMGLINNLLGVIMAKTTLDLPLGIWIMKGFYDSIPWDVEIAGIVDGASRFKTWLKVVFPLARPGIAALAVLEFISGWGEFLLIYTLIFSNTSWTLSMVIRGLIGEMGSINLNLVAALSLYYFIPVIVFFLLTQKYLLRISLGGVRG